MTAAKDVGLGENLHVESCSSTYVGPMERNDAAI
jgi:hypothetical protein